MSKRTKYDGKRKYIQYQSENTSQPGPGSGPSQPGGGPPYFL